MGTDFLAFSEDKDLYHALKMGPTLYKNEYEDVIYDFVDYGLIFTTNFDIKQNKLQIDTKQLVEFFLDNDEYIYNYFLLLRKDGITNDHWDYLIQKSDLNLIQKYIDKYDKNKRNRPK